MEIAHTLTYTNMYNTQYFYNLLFRFHIIWIDVIINYVVLLAVAHKNHTAGFDFAATVTKDFIEVCLYIQNVLSTKFYPHKDDDNSK